MLKGIIILFFPIIFLIFSFILPLTLAESQSLKIKKEIDKVWTIESSLGSQFASGNSEISSLNLTLSISHKKDKLEIESGGELDYKLANKEKAANNGRTFFKIDYDLNQYISPFYFGESSYDEMQKLDLRLNSGLGAKYTFLKNKDLDLSLSEAVLYEYEQFSSGLNEERNIRSSLRLKFKKRVLKEAKYLFVIFHQPSFSDFRNDYRIYVKTSLSVPLHNNLVFIKIGLINKYDHLPVAEVKRNDLSLITSLEINL